jgi:5-(carboxyamino)imidazole ribonucleotide synthase
MEGQKTIGIVGGGQLGRMLTMAAHSLGFKVIVIDPSDNCPASQVGALQIKAGLYDGEALRQLAKLADHITVEIEHLETKILKKLSKSNVSINPAPETIELIQDKYEQKNFLQSKGIPVAEFKKIDNYDHALEVLKDFGGKMLIKSRHGAYDGRGNALVTSRRVLQKKFAKFANRELYAEKVINFTKELAVMVAKDIKGNIKTYPLTETVHHRNICSETLVPARVPANIQKKAFSLVNKTVKHLKGSGVFGIEMFLEGEEVLINEIAPRVHNSGHYTMNGCLTSQFEQHIRAIAGLPLGDTALTSPAVCMVNILGERDGPTRVKGLHEALSVPRTYVHIYGKSPTKVDRKMGHINSVGDTIKQARSRARQARKHIDI